MSTTLPTLYLAYPKTSPASIDTASSISRHPASERFLLPSGLRHVTHDVTCVGRVVAVGHVRCGAGTCARTGGADAKVCGVATLSNPEQAFQDVVARGEDRV